MDSDAARVRFRGALLGLAAGDALGTTLEFKSPGSFSPIDDMVGGGPFGLRPGEWTDDTSMALCLAESLIERGGFDPVDQLERYVRWWREGHLSCNGRCFDIGINISRVLSRFEETQEPFPGTTDPEIAPNGSIMRLAPIPLFYSADIEEAIHYSAESSKTTHAAPRPVDACRYLGALIASAVNGRSKDELLAETFWQWGALDPEIEEIARGSFKRKQPPAIAGTGFVVRSLEAALWALHSTDSFRDGALRAVNLGDDADTTGAVYGQLAGAIYGEEAIPAEWREKLALRETIETFADRLFELGAARSKSAWPTGPIPDSYWVEPGKLLAGDYPSNRDPGKAKEKLRLIRDAGVDFFVDLTEPGEYGLRPYADDVAGLGYRRMSVHDLDIPEVKEMRAILDAIDEALAQGRTVYVHCYGGVGRTGTVVGCYLVRRGLDAEAALAQIAEWRHKTPDGRRLR
jgi:ADP-ribosyl-[dinitrogen reductase] hydrolase